MNQLLSLRKVHKLELKVGQGPSKDSLNISTMGITNVYNPTSKVWNKPRKLIGDVLYLKGALRIRGCNTIFSPHMPFCSRNSRVTKLAHTQKWWLNLSFWIKSIPCFCSEVMMEKSFSIVGNKKLLFAKFLALTCPQHINIKLNIFHFLTLHLYHPSKFDLEYTLKQKWQQYKM